MLPDDNVANIFTLIRPEVIANCAARLPLEPDVKGLLLIQDVWFGAAQL